MTLRTRWAARVGVALVLVSLLGCGKSTHAVKGTVTYQGKPLAGGGAITFLPLDNQSDKIANGTIAEDGTYSLTTSRPGDGARPGEFRVVIIQSTEKERAPTPDGAPVAARALRVSEEDRIPDIYADHRNSPLTAKVEAKALNEIHFDLKRQ
jgi:hypothetical protein